MRDRLNLPPAAKTAYARGSACTVLVRQWGDGRKEHRRLYGVRAEEPGPGRGARNPKVRAMPYAASLDG
jgi:hypothetical protein